MKTPETSAKDSKPLTSYQQTVDYLYSRLPLFTRVGAAAYKADLKNTLQLCKLLEDPQHQFKSIHIAGTNGKGSSSHMLAAILQAAGYKTGLYTSPHLRDFRERIRINGEMIPEADVRDFVNKLRTSMEEIEPSFFEVTVAMAFNHFRNHQVDIAVIETGLGGRLDSTNVISPELSLITNIGYDHMNILGSTLPEIASEKAGIIKPGVPVVISELQPEIFHVFKEKARQTASKLIVASDNWGISVDESQENPDLLRVKAVDKARSKTLLLDLDLTGLYQVQNLAGVLSSVDELINKGFQIELCHISKGLKQVQSLTGLMGRWQVLSRAPLVICDTGHNLDGIRVVLKNISNTPYSKLHFVIGMVSDKDIFPILNLLPKEAVYYFCAPDIPRARPADLLQLDAQRAGLSGAYYPDVKTAVKAAKAAAKSDDLIFIGGSTFVVAEIV